MKKVLCLLLALLMLPLLALGEEAPPVTLKILGGISESIIKEYMAEHPHVTIALDPRASSFLGLQEALVAEADIDLFLVTSDGIYTQVIEKGYAADLSESTYLVQRVATLYPWAQALLLRQGQLFAVPVSISNAYWTINRTKWQELGLGEYPRTYDDLFRLAEVWSDAYAEDYPDYCLFECPEGMPGMLRSVVRQYLLTHEEWAAPVNFDTEEFRTGIQSILDHPNIFTYDGERLALIMSYPQFLGTGFNDEDVVESFLPPALTASSQQMVSASMELLVMNPSTAHQAEALDFLEYYMAHLDARLTYELDASCTTPLRPEGYEMSMQCLTEQISALNNKIASAADGAAKAKWSEELEVLQQRYARQESNWRFSQEDIEIYQGIAEKIVLPTRTIYPAGTDASAVFDDLIAQLAAGSMPIEQFVRTLNGQASMMFLEMGL